MRRLALCLVAAVSCAREPPSEAPGPSAPREPATPASAPVRGDGAASESPSAPAPAPSVSMEATREELRRLLERGGVPLSLVVQDRLVLAREALPDFYGARDLRPAWTEGEKPAAEAAQLLEALDKAGADGLVPADYHRDAIARLLETAADPAALAELDILLTDAFLVTYAHLAVGRTDPEQLHAQWHARRRLVDAGAALEKALAAHDVGAALAAARPAYPEYQALVRSRERLLALGPAGWPPVRSTADLSPRLVASGDLEEGAADEAEVTAALQRFQARHGLRGTGKLDEATLRALSVPAATRVAQIEANLERWRWLPEDLGARHILVNIAGMNLRYVEDGKTALAMKVVVGKKYRKTPVFSVPVQYLVFNPQWSVPHKIATRDILPKLRKDPGYLAAHRMRVYGRDGHPVNAAGIDWDKVSAKSFPYKLWQAPGPDNALGKVKFMFPNPHDVFLHDTNKPILFTGEQRAASSGCVRLEHPLDLATLVLAGTGTWDRKAIDRAVSNGVERAVYLDTEVWLHLLYWTAWEEDGVLHFRDDIYGRDRPLLRALAERPPPAHSGL